MKTLPRLPSNRRSKLAPVHERYPWTIHLCAALVALAASACSKKEKECRVLVDEMTEARAAFEKTDHDYAKSAEMFEGASKEMAAIELTVPELKDRREKYKEILDQFAAVSRLIIQAKEDKTKLKEARAATKALNDLDEKKIYLDTLELCAD